MIVNTGMPAKYMAMADLDRMECVPILFVLYPSVFSPMKQTIACSQSSVTLDVICFRFLLESMYVLMVMDGPVSGYDRMRFTIAAQHMTGHSS
jgi:hypothetical protein